MQRAPAKTRGSSDAAARQRAEAGAALADDKIKSLTGGDVRMSRKNFGDFFEWIPHGLPVLSFNRMPTIKGDDFGTRRRLAFIPFEANLREDIPVDQQKRMPEVLAEMAPERSGILNILIRGMVDAHHRRGLHPPESADVMKEALLSQSDPVGAFIAACCEKKEGARIRTSRFL